MSVKKPKQKHKICPYFVRQVQSKNFHGIKCRQYFITDHVGQLAQWTEAERDKYLSRYCFDHYLSCPIYQGQTKHVKKDTNT